MDISATTAPDSTQVNAEDFLGGPRVVTITGVRAGTSEQPVNIDIAEFPGRAYRPGKSMRRVLVAAWGPEASAYTGRQIELYNDPDITFGRDRTGGIRISRISHLSKPLTVALTVTRGRRKPFTVEPLPDAKVTPTDTSAPSPAQVAASMDQAELRAWWNQHPDLRGVIESRVAELKGDQS